MAVFWGGGGKKGGGGGGGIKEQTHYSAYNIPPKNLSHKRNIDTTVLKETKSRTYATNLRNIASYLQDFFSDTIH